MPCIKGGKPFDIETPRFWSTSRTMLAVVKRDSCASFLIFLELSMTHSFQRVSSRAGGGGVAGNFTPRCNIQSGEVPFQQARSLHPTLGSSIMLSPKQVAKPTSSCPAQYHQDTTSPWSTDYRGNIYQKLISDTDAGNEKIWKKNRMKKKHIFQKKKMEKEKKR